MSKRHQDAILRAQTAVTDAERAYRDAIRAAGTDPDERASIRELASFTGLAPGTIRRILSGE